MNLLKKLSPFTAYNTDTRAIIQCLSDGLRGTKNKVIKEKISYMLFDFNLTIAIAKVYEISLHKDRTKRNWLFVYFYRRNLNLFLSQFHQEYFDSNNKYELEELQRSQRVIDYFLYDYFYYGFKKRDLGNILYE